MEDDDLFFEDDLPEESPPAKTSKTAPKGGARKPAGTKTAAKPSPAKPAARPAAARTVEVQEANPNSINLTVAVLFMVITFLVGFVAGTLLERSHSNPAAPATSAATQGTAPALTPQQLQQGQLPAGHPQINGLPTPAPATKSPSKPAAKSPSSGKK